MSKTFRYLIDELYADVVKSMKEQESSNIKAESAKEESMEYDNEYTEEQTSKVRVNRYKNKDVSVQNKGTKIVLPDDPFVMSKHEAVVALERAIAADETKVAIHEEVDAHPLDGAYAFMQVLKDTYGWADAVPKPPQGFFGQEEPPVMVNIEIGYKENAQVIWGNFKVPGIDGLLATGATRKDGRFIFVINGKVKKKCQDAVRDLAKSVRDYVEARSIYKGKAIRLNTTSDGGFDPNTTPKFLDLSDGKKLEKELTFSDSVQEQIQTNLFTPIEKTQMCRELSIPLKRTVLLEGPFGTGKTLTARVAAYKGTQPENGWTYIYLDRVTAIDQALVFARHYAPAIIFAEDIDRVMPEGRTVKVDDVLNNIDGVDSKNAEIITILTTNDVNKIEKAMIRPGRLDAIISVQPPDAKAAEKLMRLYSRGLIEEDENLAEAGGELDGQIPATIREVVERAKLYAISRLEKGDKLTSLKGSDLAQSARGMKMHLELLNEKQEEDMTPEFAVGAALGKLVQNHALNGRGAKIDHVNEMVDEIRDRV